MVHMVGAGNTERILTADEAGLVGCRMCCRAWPKGQERCGLCGSRLHSPDTASLQWVWAWLIAGLVFYIPANLFPMLYTDTLIYSSGATILGGVIEFFQYGDYFVASVIFIASILIPICKFAVIAFLAVSVQRGQAGGVRYQHVYEVVDFIGRWSMIDVFVVAILSALVQLGFVASIHPGTAAAAFALSVAFTMVSAHSFDSRLVWRKARKSGRNSMTGPKGQPPGTTEQVFLHD
ncbi:paraquat-inducible protein A [Haematobacter sp.]